MPDRIEQGARMPLDRLKRVRERLALALAPWLYVPYRTEREEAFKDLAEVAYLSRDAVWTSPRVLVRTALEQAAMTPPTQVRSWLND
jgi:hypothetical protein